MHIEKKKLDDTHNILLSGCVITGKLKSIYLVII